MTLPRTARLVLALVLVGLAGAAGSAARIGSESRQLAWTEVSWPFLLDQWGTGQAFRCEHEGCGAEARLFVRMKRGFCNCFKGVADDDEVDRLTDFEFLGGPSQPLGPGRPVKFADMGGRMRAFAVDSAEVPYRHAVSLVVSRDCDALVATFISDREAVSPDANIANLLPPKILANLP
jgi:hypothetical protein